VKESTVSDSEVAAAGVGLLTMMGGMLIFKLWLEMEVVIAVAGSMETRPEGEETVDMSGDGKVDPDRDGFRDCDNSCGSGTNGGFEPSIAYESTCSSSSSSSS
jgi:hypothetical protein